MAPPHDGAPVLPSAFWGELAPSAHLVQFYSGDDGFVDTLETFVSSGFDADEAVVVIATPEHRAALEARLVRHGHDPAALAAEGRYVPLDARETLERFMVDDWPDEDAFERVVQDVLARARRARPRVRAFGEMVALLWADGRCGATVRLEHLWHSLCAEESLALYCAYPKSGFTGDPTTSLQEICAAHSRVLPG